MIGRITGLLLEKIPPLVLVDVRGVGYEIDVPMSTFYNLPAIGTEIVLHTHLVVREDVHLLFGFAHGSGAIGISPAGENFGRRSQNRPCTAVRLERGRPASGSGGAG